MTNQPPPPGPTLLGPQTNISGGVHTGGGLFNAGMLTRLLIFDNCEDPALLEEWHPKASGCRILLTSRRACWRASQAVTTIPVSGLPRKERSHRVKGASTMLVVFVHGLFFAAVATLGANIMTTLIHHTFLRIHGYAVPVRSKEVSANLACVSLKWLHQLASPYLHGDPLIEFAVTDRSLL